jgi:hypothetical protein
LSVMSHLRGPELLGHAVSFFVAVPASCPGGADILGRCIVAEKDKAGAGGGVDAPLQRRKEAREQVAQARRAPGLLGDEFAAAGSRVRCSRNGESCTGRLIGAQNIDNMHETKFYLGNVGQKLVSLFRKQEGERCLKLEIRTAIGFFSKPVCCY